MSDKENTQTPPESEKKKKLGAGKIILIVIASILAVILIPSAIIFGSLVAQYNKLAYEKHHPVEREDEYVMPDYPEITIDTSGEWQEGVDLIPETEMQETEAETEIETEVTETETETETDPSESLYAEAGKKDILRLGTDSRDVTLDRGRSDVMIIASYNSKKGTLKLTSLLRDSLVPIEGVGWNRLNTAYFYGGVGLSINTINQLYGLDIQQFLVVDFGGVKDFIEYVGGVDIELTEEEAALYSLYTGRTISPGLNPLDPELAPTHMRNRSIGHDFGTT